MRNKADNVGVIKSVKTELKYYSRWKRDYLCISKMLGGGRGWNSFPSLLPNLILPTSQ